MSTKTQRALLAGAAIAAVLVLGQLSRGEAIEQSGWLISYCTDAAIWQAEEARGVPLNQRTGQPDYRGIAAESCPGMRPAAPALDEYTPAQFAMPETVPVNQLVQF